MEFIQVQDTQDPYQTFTSPNSDSACQKSNVFPTESQSVPKNDKSGALTSRSPRRNLLSPRANGKSTARSSFFGTNRSSNRSPRPRPLSLSPQEEAQFTHLAQSFLAGDESAGEGEDPSTLAAVVAELENQRDILISSRAYSQSRHCQRASEAARAAQLRSLKRQCQEAEIADIQGRKEVLSKRTTEVATDLDARSRNLDEILEDQRNQMILHHQHELGELEKEWRSDQKRRLFDRSSTKLKNMRAQSARLISIGRFDEGTSLALEADNLENAEVLENHRLYYSAYVQSKNALVKKQQTELSLFESTAAEKRDKLEVFKRKIIEPLEKQAKAIQMTEENARDMEKVWIHKHRFDPDQHLQSSRPRGAGNYQINMRDLNKLPLPPLPEIS